MRVTDYSTGHMIFIDIEFFLELLRGFTGALEKNLTFPEYHEFRDGGLLKTVSKLMNFNKRPNTQNVKV